MVQTLGFGPPDLAIIAMVALILFGPQKLPELMRGLGKGLREFKRAASDFQDEVHAAIERQDTPVPAALPSPPATAPLEPTPPGEAEPLPPALGESAAPRSP